MRSSDPKALAYAGPSTAVVNPSAPGAARKVFFPPLVYCHTDRWTKLSIAVTLVPGGLVHAQAATPSLSPSLTYSPHHPQNLPTQDSVGLFLDEDTTGDRQYFIFYQDEGGLQATDEENGNLSTIYYLGVIDILTPYGVVKRAEHVWKTLLAGAGDRVSLI